MPDPTGLTRPRDAPAVPSAISTATRWEERIAALLVAAGLCLTALYGRASPEGVIHFDDVTHYLMARWSWTYPAWLVDDWGRPGFTALYALPARFGWPMARVMSAILSAWSAWFAFRIAQRLALKPAWTVVPLLYAQPLFFQLSETTLTETPLAFYLTTAVYLALSKRWTLSAAILSLGFVTRHEAIVFLPIWLTFAWRDRVSLWRLWPILWAPITVVIFARIAGMGTVLDRFLNPHPSSQYGHGGWLTFFARSLHAFGPALAIVALTGIVGLVRRPGGLMVAACIVVYFATQTIIRALGLFDSGGYARFLVAISPLVAISALAGLRQLLDGNALRRHAAYVAITLSVLLFWHAMERQLELMREAGDALAEVPRLGEARLAVIGAFRRIIAVALISIVAERLVSFALNRIPALSRSRALSWPRVHGLAAVPIVLLWIAVLTADQLCRPLEPLPEVAAIDEALHWIKTSDYADRPIIAAVVWMHYKLDQPRSPHGANTRQSLAQAPIGSLFAWEEQFAEAPDHNMSYAELWGSPCFKMVYETQPIYARWKPYMTIFEKVADWDPNAFVPATRGQHR